MKRIYLLLLTLTFFGAIAVAQDPARGADREAVPNLEAAHDDMRTTESESNLSTESDDWESAAQRALAFAASLREARSEFAKLESHESTNKVTELSGPPVSAPTAVVTQMVEALNQTESEALERVIARHGFQSIQAWTQYGDRLIAAVLIVRTVEQLGLREVDLEVGRRHGDVVMATLVEE